MRKQNPLFPTPFKINHNEKGKDRMGKEVYERGPSKNCPPILPFNYLVLIRNDKINCKKKDYKVIKVSYIKYRNISYKFWIKKFRIYLVFLGHFITGNELEG